MANGYKRGDVLIPMLNEIAGELPVLQRQGQEFLLKQSSLALDNRKLNVVEEQQKYQNEQAKEQQELAQKNMIEQRTFRDKQAKIREMNTMLQSAKSPSQKAMIYNNFGQYDMAAQVKTEGDKVEDDNAIVENYWSESLGSSPNDVVIAGKSALGSIDLSHPNYSSIAERTDKAYQEALNPYRDMMNDPTYEYQAKLLLAAGKMPNADMQGIFDQYESMKARYLKGKFGGKDDEEDDNGKLLSIDEQAEQLVSGFLDGDAFKPKDSLDIGPQTELDVKQVATQVEASSEVNIGKLQSSLPKLENRKSILDRTAKLRKLTDIQTKELEQINATIKATKDEVKRQRGSLKQARKETKPFYTSPTATKFSSL